VAAVAAVAVAVAAVAAAAVAVAAVERTRPLLRGPRHARRGTSSSLLWTEVKLVFLSQLIQEWFVQSLRRTTSLSEVQGPKATALRKASKLCSRPLLRSRPVV